MIIGYFFTIITETGKNEYKINESYLLLSTSPNSNAVFKNEKTKTIIIIE